MRALKSRKKITIESDEENEVVSQKNVMESPDTNKVPVKSSKN